MEKWKKAGVHKDLVGCKISEFHKDIPNCKFVLLRFVATIRGYRNWKIVEEPANKVSYANVIEKVKEIRDRIDAGDKSVFERPNQFNLI